MKNISVKAIFAGCLVFYLLRSLLAAIPILYALRDILWRDLTLWQLAKTIVAAPDEYLKLYYFQIFVDPLSALIAGFVAARMAGKNPLINSALAILPGALQTLYRMKSDGYAPLSSPEILLIAATALCALLGGFFAGLRNSAAAHQ